MDIKKPVILKPDQASVDLKVLSLIEDLEAKMSTLDAKLVLVAEFESRLMKAFGDEIELQKQIAKVTPNIMQKQAAENIQAALRRVMQRWTSDMTFKINLKEMTIDQYEK